MSLESDIKSLVESLDLELYDTAVVNENDETIYRVSVVSGKTTEDGKKAGVSMDSYVELTHLISPLLDVTPPLSGEYRLEVGSPGIERKLNNIGHFKKSIGEDVSILMSNKEKYKGKLLRVEGNKIYLEVDKEEVEIDYSDISKAKTYFEW
ncbi:MAG: ribosome maturation factor [Sulfurimonas sp.]|jgi:ribosome maturation factor RimP